MKKNATKKLEAFSLSALLQFQFDNSQNDRVVPQTGHSMPNILSNKQKCGMKFKIPISGFLKKTKTIISSKLLINMLTSFCLSKSLAKYFKIHFGIIEISILNIHFMAINYMSSDE